MGSVYVALAQGPAGFSKLKVVKHLLPDLADDALFRAMFMEEARLAARLNHPNVVQTNEVGFDGRNYFMEMEYLEGVTFETLSRRAAAAGGLPLDVGLYVLSQVLAGLHYAHELRGLDGEPLQIVHRDVSPPNIIVTYAGAVKVLDFGIAKAADSESHTRTGDLRGKVTYMAPEQACRGAVDRRADLFAVGVMLWQLLTGQRLHDGLVDEEILSRLRSLSVPRPASIRADISPTLDRLCMAALAPRPSDRFATAEEFQVAIEEYLSNTGHAVGPRQIATIVGNWFGSRRQAVRAELETQVRAVTAAARSSASVPVLSLSPAVRAAASERPTEGPHHRAPAAADERAPLSPPRQPVLDSTPFAGTPGARRDIVPARRRRRLLQALVATAAAVALGVAAHRGAPLQRRGERAVTLRCASHADCAEGGPGSRLFCGRGGACVPATECATNNECTGRIGRPALCNPDSRCVAFDSDDCRVFADPPDLANDEALWFGVVMPQTGPAAAAFGTAVTHSIDLARRDLMSTTNGLPSPRVGRSPRPIGLVVCDDTDLRRATQHLVEELQVPAVVGFGGPNELVTIAPSLFAHQVLAIETNSSQASILSVPAPAGQPRLLWRTTGSAADEGKPLAATVEHLLEATGRSRANDVRVALVRLGNPSSLSIAESFVSECRIRGEKLASQPNAFRQYVYRPGEEASTIDDLLEFRPSLVIGINNGFAESIALPLETRWHRERERPLYVFDGTMGADAFRFLGRDASRRRRYFGVDFPANTDTNLKFALRYNEFFSPHVTPGTAPGVAYDALFVLAYAAAATSDEPVTGLSLSRGIGRLLPGPGSVPVDVGGAAAFRAFGALRGGANIDLNGAGTPLDFDVASGETAADYAVYCGHVDAHGFVDDAMESGLRYSAVTHALTGPLSCP